MKYFFTVLLSMLMTLTAYTQSETIPTNKKNAIGLSISPLDIGLAPLDKDVPTVRLEYRRALKDKLELRFSLGYQHDSNDISDSGYSIALGLNRYLFQSKKVNIYAAGEVFFDRVNLEVFNRTEPGSFELFKNSNIGVGTLLGVELRATSRFDIFLESNLVDLTVFEKFGDSKRATLDNFRFLRGAEVGVKYRF